MAYCDRNFKTKKALREAVARGDEVTIYQPGAYDAPRNGETSIEGPHYPAAHTWYARAMMVDGIVASVK